MLPADFKASTRSSVSAESDALLRELLENLKEVDIQNLLKESSASGRVVIVFIKTKKTTFDFNFLFLPALIHNPMGTNTGLKTQLLFVEIPVILIEKRQLEIKT